VVGFWYKLALLKCPTLSESVSKALRAVTLQNVKRLLKCLHHYGLRIYGKAIDYASFCYKHIKELVSQKQIQANKH
jgi:hypothetical protein